MLAQQQCQLLFAPSGGLFSKLKHCLGKLRTPCRLTQPPGMPGTVLQEAWMLKVVNTLPFVEGLIAYAKVTAGESCVIAVAVIEVKPL